MIDTRSKQCIVHLGRMFCPRIRNIDVVPKRIDSGKCQYKIHYCKFDSIRIE